jgi:hypothetical protein
LEEGIIFLSADLVHLKWMGHFTQAFFARATHEGAKITCK